MGVPWEALEVEDSQHRLKSHSNTYIEFSDPPFADQSYFEKHLKSALDQQQYGPDYAEFKRFMLRGDPYAIVTDREHGASTLRAGIRHVLDRFSVVEKDMLGAALAERLSCDPATCIDKYLDEWDFYAVNGPEFRARFGAQGPDARGTAFSKVKAIRHFVDKCLAKVRHSHSDIEFRFSDNEPLTIEIVRPLLAKLQDDKSTLFPRIRFLTVDTSPPPDVVRVAYSDVQSGMDMRRQILSASGPGGVGIILQCGIPGMPKASADLLPLARRLAVLPPETLAHYERKETSYCFGWSRGRESFKGKPDVAKGSFYNNPLFDDPADGNESVRAQFPYAASRNEWPSAELPELEPTFKRMGRIAYEAAKPLVRHLDAFVASRVTNYSDALYKSIFTESRLTLGRLLHYYAGKEDSWCGWHNDNSAVTVLTPEMWMDEDTGEETSDPGSAAGLRVKTSSGKMINVTIPKDCLGFQIGEAAQILSGGVLRATPHSVAAHVSANGTRNISRETFALFIEPQWDKAIGPPPSRSYEHIFQGEERELIPPLSRRLLGLPVTFGHFLGQSFREYYRHNNPREPGLPGRLEL